MTDRKRFEQKNICNRLILIQGLPSTRKTYLAEAVFPCHVDKYPAVSSSACNQAVDNLLRRLFLRAAEFSPDRFSRQLIGRVGRQSKPDIPQFSILSWLGVTLTTKKVRQTIQNVLENDSRISAGTLSVFLASGHTNCVLYLDPSHVYCFVLVDEVAPASGVAIYGVLLAMRRGGVAFVIGDQKHLRPYVNNLVARDKRPGLLLFNKLFQYDGIPKHQLSMQYRAHPPISSAKWSVACF